MVFEQATTDGRFIKEITSADLNSNCFFFEHHKTINGCIQIVRSRNKECNSQLEGQRTNVLSWQPKGMCRKCRQFVLLFFLEVKRGIKTTHQPLRITFFISNFIIFTVSECSPACGNESKAKVRGLDNDFHVFMFRLSKKCPSGERGNIETLCESSLVESMH